jgi:hypothetical protein
LKGRCRCRIGQRLVTGEKHNSKFGAHVRLRIFESLASQCLVEKKKEEDKKTGFHSRKLF